MSVSKVITVYWCIIFKESLKVYKPENWHGDGSEVQGAVTCVTYGKVRFLFVSDKMGRLRAAPFINLVWGQIQFIDIQPTEVWVAAVHGLELLHIGSWGINVALFSTACLRRP